jgi:hypothetical protein
MDGKLFDELTLSLGAEKTRRGALRLLAGGALGAVLTRLGLEEAAARCVRLGGRCERSRECCAGGCQGRRCRCGTGTKACNGRCIPAGQCCNGCPAGQDCQNGACVPHRRVSVGSSMDIEDDETFGSPERCHYDDGREVVLSQATPRRSFGPIVRGCGGEVRIEIYLDGERLGNGDVRISGIAHLFEGTSEQTTDHDGDEVIPPFVVPAGSTAQHSFRVRNEDEGGDFADIRLEVANRAA